MRMVKQWLPLFLLLSVGMTLDFSNRIMPSKGDTTQLERTLPLFSPEPPSPTPPRKITGVANLFGIPDKNELLSTTHQSGAPQDTVWVDERRLRLLGIFEEEGDRWAALVVDNGKNKDKESITARSGMEIINLRIVSVGLDHVELERNGKQLTLIIFKSAPDT
ncbi:MAG: hypothetical protein HQL52_15495 [Magnetococcales bacterium]|nr:hypothetical protein [Magnetococcales bacterium]